MVDNMANPGRFDILMHVQPWQVLLFDGAALVDLATNQLGAAGITLSIKAAASQDVVALNPAGESVAARLAAGVLWQARSEQYASTRLRPVVSPSLKSRQPLARIADLCRQGGHVFRLRLSALQDGAMVARHGDAAAVNALSLPMVRHLCPSNPDVLEVVRCQLVDLHEQFAPDVIEIESFTWLDGYHAAPDMAATWPVAPGPVESALLAICFCPSCRQQASLADVNAVAALRSVQVRLMRWLQGEKPLAGTLGDALAEDEILTAYIACQREALLAGLQVWMRAVPQGSLVIEGDRVTAHYRRGKPGSAGSGGRPIAAPGALPEVGRDGSPWNPSFEELTTLAPRLTVHIAPGDTGCLCEPQPSTGSSRIEAAVNAADPAFAGGPDIVRCLTDLARADVAGLELEGCLHVSPSRQPFIRQAIRAARRERTL
jgi:hypothetical protein